MDIFNNKKVAGLEFDISYYLDRIKALEKFIKEENLVAPPRPPQERLYVEYMFSRERIR